MCLIDHVITDHTVILRYNENDHNCLDFVVAIWSVVTSQVCTRQVLSQLVAPRVAQARAYQTLCSLVTEHGGVYMMGGKL